MNVTRMTARLGCLKMSVLEDVDEVTNSVALALCGSSFVTFCGNPELEQMAAKNTTRLH